MTVFSDYGIKNEVFTKLFPANHNEFCSGIFSDELDKMGVKNQVSTSWKINNPQNRMFGRVRTLELETIGGVDERIDIGLGFLDTISPGEVLVVKGSDKFAYFGELMSRLALSHGISGIIIDGLTRDHFFTQCIELPILCKGYSPVDIKGRGRVGKIDVPLFIDDIKINVGDFVFADCEASIFIPEFLMGQLAIKINEAALVEVKTKQMISDNKTIREILSEVKEF